MIPTRFYLLPAGLMLAAFADQAAERTGGSSLADSDRQTVRPAKTAARPIEEAPLFRIDPKGPPAAMTADTERRARVREAPRSITEKPQPR